MKILVESLKRLYSAGKVTIEKLEQMKQKGIITAAEMTEIVMQ